MRRIKSREAIIKDEVKQQLSKIEYVSTTADVWSNRHYSYMGLSAHYISEDLKRQSVLLACEHFKGSHTGERVADIIYEKHEDFDLRGGKVVSTNTDNAANMVKAFKLFGVKLDYNDDDEEDEEQAQCDDDSVSDSDTETGEENFQNNPLLPKHHR